MPVNDLFTEQVSVNVGGIWTEIPARNLVLKEAKGSPVVEFSFEISRTADVAEATWNALVLNAQVQIYQRVGATEDSFTGRIARKPRLRIGPVPALSVTGYDETITATYKRFIDIWPKDGVTTASQILTDAWQRYGPAGLDLSGVQANSASIGPISSNLDTLFDFTQEWARRTGWAWRIRNNRLEAWDPTKTVFATGLEQGSNIIGDTVQIGDELPQVANVVYVPARVRAAEFEDKQPSRAGQAQYLLQYEPLSRQFEAVGGTVYIDEPPKVYLAGVLQTAAEDGGADADTSQVVYNVENRFVRFNAGYVPAQDGLEVKAVYTAEIPVIVRRRHSSSVDLFGEIEERIIRSPRPTREEAEQIADAFLRQRALPIRPVRLGTSLFGLRPGMYVQVTIPDEGIDQLMPVVEVTRSSRPANLDITVALNQAPFNDSDIIFELFRRLSRLESAQTARQQRVESYESWEEGWSWAEEFTTALHQCPIPAEDLYPSEDLIPC